MDAIAKSPLSFYERDRSLVCLVRYNRGVTLTTEISKSSTKVETRRMHTKNLHTILRN